MGRNGRTCTNRGFSTNHLSRINTKIDVNLNVYSKLYFNINELKWASAL